MRYTHVHIHIHMYIPDVTYSGKWFTFGRLLVRITTTVSSIWRAETQYSAIAWLSSGTPNSRGCTSVHLHVWSNIQIHVLYKMFSEFNNCQIHNIQKLIHELPTVISPLHYVRRYWKKSNKIQHYLPNGSIIPILIVSLYTNTLSQAAVHRSAFPHHLMYSYQMWQENSKQDDSTSVNSLSASGPRFDTKVAFTVCTVWHSQCWINYFENVFN